MGVVASDISKGKVYGRHFLVIMIFIAVGTQKFQMNRLLETVDRMIADGRIKETVFAQTGHCDYVPTFFHSKDFLEVKEFEIKVKECSLLITHGGVSVIMTGLKYGKTVIAIPRLSSYGEHVDDHQKEIISIFSNMNLILSCHDLTELAVMIEMASSYTFDKYVSSREVINDFLYSYIQEEKKEQVKDKPNVLMVGVDSKRIGGMWTVAETYLNSSEFNDSVNLTYVATNTYGSAGVRVLNTLIGYWKVLWNIVFHHVSLVHIHMAEKGSTYRKGMVVHIAHFFNKKVVVQLHAGPFMAFYDTQSTKQQRWIRKMFEKCDNVLALGEYWRNQLYSLVPPEKVKVLYNGTICPETNPYNVTGKKILYLGVMKQAKGTFDLLEALHIIDSKLDPSIQVCICGLPEEDGIEEKIEELGLQSRVKLLGWITKEQRLKLFEDTMIVVHPSWFEALSMTVLEASAYGIPVVTTDISTMPEILGSDVEMVPVKEPEALGKLILKWSRDPALRSEISKKLYKNVKEKFSVQQNIRNTLKIYEDVLKNDE